MDYELDSTIYNGKHIISQDQWKKHNNEKLNEKHNIAKLNEKHNIAKLNEKHNIDNSFTYLRCFCCKIKIIFY